MSNSLLTVTNDGKTYFIQSKFGEESNCEITITDCIDCWNIKISLMMIEEYASEANLLTDDYLKMMKSALSSSIVKKEYNYTIDHCSEDIILEWKKTQQEIKYCLGRFRLTKISSKDALCGMLTNCCKQTQNVILTNQSTLLENKTLNNTILTLNDELRKCTQLKEDLEFNLMGKFVLILNEKKAKIRKLQEQITRDKKRIEDLENKLDWVIVEPDSPPNRSIMSTMQTPILNKIKPKIPKKDLINDEDSLEILGPLPKRNRNFIEKEVSLELELPEKRKEDEDKSYFSDANTTTTSADSTVDVEDLIDDL